MPEAQFGWFVQLSDRDGAEGHDLRRVNSHFIEQLGPAFDSLWFCDHLQYDHHQVLEGWTSVSNYAARYPRFRVGTLVLCQSYRNPALLAKMAATLQYLSGGRLILGLGAGWKEDEYGAYGYPFPDIRTRVEQLEEASQILKLLWQKRCASFQGKHYQLADARCEPRPNPLPPLLIGGGGEKYTLPVVAKHADWMNLYFPDLPTYRHKVEVLRNYCQQAGRDFDDITQTLHCYLLVSEDGNLPSAREDRHIISGTPEQVSREIKMFIGAGVQHFIIRFLDFPAQRSLDLFQERVVPMLDE